MILRAATRASALALWQANHVRDLLVAAGAVGDVELVQVSTSGDRDQTTPIHAMGGKGVFVKEVQAAVLDGRADFAVHSAKDLPALTPEGLTIAAVPARADVRDALVGATLTDLAPGAVVGTGSVRRRVQLQQARPDISFVELRGNIDTRLGRLDELDAIIMAAAALDRLERSPAVVERLDLDVMTPQVGQGALAIEVRADDTAALQALTHIQDAEARRLLDAERSFLIELGGDCDLPAGAHAVLDSTGFDLRAVLANEAGDVVERVRLSGDDGPDLGRLAATQLQARLTR
jgi:hydroxymethylbilane synthase